MQWIDVDLLDESESVNDFRQAFAGNVHARAAAEANAEENGIELPFQFGHGNLLSHFDITADFNAKILNHVDFGEAHFRFHFVISDPVGVQSTGLRPGFKDD